MSVLAKRLELLSSYRKNSINLSTAIEAAVFPKLQAMFLQTGKYCYRYLY